MKYTILGFNQIESIKLGLDLTDLMILRWFVDFRNTESMASEIYNDEEYYWIKYESLLKDIPICGINNNDSLRRRLKKMVLCGVFKHYTKRKFGTFSFYKLGESYNCLISGITSDRTTQKSEGTTQKSEGYDSKVGGGTTQKSEGYDSKVGAKDPSIKDPSIKKNKSIKDRENQLSPSESFFDLTVKDQYVNQLGIKFITKDKKEEIFNNSNEFMMAMTNYKAKIAREKTPEKFILNLSTFCDRWEEFVNVNTNNSFNLEEWANG